MTALRNIILASLLGLSVFVACNETLAGDRCDTSADCDPPLVCSNENAPAPVLGICVPPEALFDAGTPPDTGIADAAEIADASPTHDASPNP